MLALDLICVYKLHISKYYLDMSLGGDGGFIPPKISTHPPNKLMLTISTPNENMFPFPKNRLTYTQVTQHLTLDICYHPSNTYSCTSYSFYHTFTPLAEGGGRFFRTFRIKRGGNKFCGIKGEPKFALQNFEVGEVFS